ncbi:MAG: nickel-dependent hydrogenase large subunit [Candidatus Omnitrophica bacterium]|nr:nickel-dependent hydrogenase large subunit [Candidatus Omnitrophota bacterium]
MQKKILIDPVTRIEGHLKVELEIEDGTVVCARSSGMLYRGIEQILLGHDPRDATQITQRICGVCPIAHGIASSMCLDSAFGISDKIPENAWLIRNLIHASNHIHNSILHFYHLAALDYVDITKVKKGKSPEIDLVIQFLQRSEKNPFVPREEDFRFPDDINQRILENYLRALEIRKVSHEALAIFGGKMPHQSGIIPGGVTQKADAGKIEGYLGKIKEISEFVNFYYWQDLIDLIKYYPECSEIGRGCGNLLAYGAFPVYTSNGLKKFQPGGVYYSSTAKVEDIVPEKITEAVEYSWYQGETSHPSVDFPQPDPFKQKAYSWLKSPRYNGEVFEVGPLARVMIAYAKNAQPWKDALVEALDVTGMNIENIFSVAGRHLCRGIECKILLQEVGKWLLKIDPFGEFYYDYEIPAESKGVGLSEGARGAVGHWIIIKDRKIAHYQVVSPTTWNCSPRDDAGKPGPLEQALSGLKLKNENQPVEALRVIRSFDPCLACSVQLKSSKNIEAKRFYLWA